MEPEFIEKVPSFFNCPICLSFIKNCVSTPCHHKFCSECLDNSLNLSNACPLCRSVIIKESLNHDKWMDSKISSLQVYCNFKKNGCQWKGSYSDLKNHLGAICDYTQISCPNSCCTTHLQRKKMNDHLKVCNYRKVACEYCSSNILFCSKDNHHNNECPKVLIRCNFCKDLVPKNILDEHHLTVCKNMLVVCPYGCETKIQRKYLDEHLRSKPIYHLKVLFEQVKLLQNEVKDLKEKKNIETEKPVNVVQLNDDLNTTEITHILVWKVDTKKLFESNGKRIVSPKFKIKNSEFNIQLYCFSNGNTKILSYFLHSQLIESPMKLSYKLWNEGCKDETVFQKCQLNFEKSEEEYGWSGVNYEGSDDIQIKLEIISIE